VDAAVVEGAVEAWVSAVAVHLVDVEVQPLESSQRFRRPSAFCKRNEGDIYLLYFPSISFSDLYCMSSVFPYNQCPMGSDILGGRRRNWQQMLDDVFVGSKVIWRYWEGRHGMAYGKHDVRPMI
jgi:hypothetical protein